MVCVVLCVLMLNDMLMNVCFLLYIFFICCVYDFMFELKSERKRNEFQLFLYLSKDSCKECS
jgi:hypothetical protein